ncbi:hypothetical protein [Serratia liquefaciens]|uniref:hypothetical protein n=1 Tax=Serratia liquefaciens TaxID=614 RepID=UPI002157D357|nr:hypothetical protein [Serratia liquefaciens]
MKISSLFRSKPVAKLPSYTSSEISNSAKNFLNELKKIKNTAESKGEKNSRMYKKQKVMLIN